jgi:Peptidase family M23
MMQKPIAMFLASAGFFLPLAPGAGAALELGLPIDCALGETCFIQQYPDLAAGPDVADPWCGGASYDGHDGTDIRVLSMQDVAAGVPVIAAADGVVRGVRDGVPDRLVASEVDRQAVATIECGNGVVLDNGEGFETQYCHMREGSVVVSQGQSVTRGEVLGFVGASGLAQFPHVHLSVRKDGIKLDPFTGRALTEGCGMASGAGTASLWDAAVTPTLTGQEGEILALGFAGAPPDYDALVVDGPPPEAARTSENFVAWAWFINLRQGDEVIIRLEAADGALIAENAMAPLDRNKAAYAAFAGKKGAPKPGTYIMRAVVVRDGVPAISEEKEITLE